MNITKFASLIETDKKGIYKHFEKTELNKDKLSIEQMRQIAEKMNQKFNKTWDGRITITVSNNKGGISKSTFCVHLAYILKQFYELEVLLLSVDPQGNITNSFFSREKQDYNLFRLMKSYKNKKPENPLDFIVSLDRLGNVDYIPVDMEFAGIEQWDNMDCVYLKDIIEDIENKYHKKYDCIIIDTPPTVSRPQVAGLLATDYLVVPMESEIQSITGANNVLELVDTLSRWIDVKGIAGFVSMYEQRLVDKSTSERIYSIFEDKMTLFKTKIPRCVAGKEVFTRGKTVYDYEKDDKLSAAYLEIVRELMEFIANEQ
ncbi:MAG: ParA family protein [Candidatus Sericytochromatia bacterium]